MSDLYKIAAQKRYRFETIRGPLDVEQLFQVPLKATDGFDLNTLAKKLNKRIADCKEDSFVDDDTVAPFVKDIENCLDIVKDVIATKQAEKKASLDRAKKALERKKILDAISAKQDEKISQASLEELEKQLAALED